MGRLLYLFQNTISLRDLDRYGIHKILEAGNELSLIDLGDTIFPQLTKDRRHYGDVPCEIQAPTPNSALNVVYKELRRASVVIANLQTHGPTDLNWRFLRAVSESHAPYVVLRNNVFPRAIVSKRRRMRSRLQQLIYRVIKPNPLLSLIARAPIRFLGIRPANFAVVGGMRSETPHPLITDSTVRIRAHSSDYEMARLVPHSAIRRGDYHLFIDQCLDTHPDFIEAHTSRAIDSKGYLERLEACFSRIEAMTGKPVIIAAHPRRNLESHDGTLFNGRKMIVGQTIDLLAGCRSAITHTSTAAGIAALYRKPLLLIAEPSHYWSRLAAREHAEGLAAALSRPLHFLDRIETVRSEDLTMVNEAAYARYVHDYVKQEDSPDGALFELMLEQFRSSGIDVEGGISQNKEIA